MDNWIHQLSSTARQNKKNASTVEEEKQMESIRDCSEQLRGMFDELMGTINGRSDLKVEKVKGHKHVKYFYGVSELIVESGDIFTRKGFLEMSFKIRINDSAYNVSDVRPRSAYLKDLNSCRWETETGMAFDEEQVSLLFKQALLPYIEE
ncbi:hypothetical protein CHL76_09285 [Marinococcus halophilus]|uniref:Uncharacterized protein n=1 Tax=Marinococcus halophilus TaxID=1371 RepID=A0A510Y4T9_MARHA|nr:hypothetical protein [Marinococcus halophilus]OZT80289.1 hypothetical protein CHL76_09285 [Marinococcus halophilus]GEK58352.1 hypothetical protein MHA01_12570 [Marinococcus halophilus]